MGLSENEKRSMKCLAVVIQYRSVTDGRTGGRNCYINTASIALISKCRRAIKILVKFKVL